VVHRLVAGLSRRRFWALALKELRQIRRDRRLRISLIVPPVLQVLLFGFALDSEVRNCAWASSTRAARPRAAS
jgi:ABC-2 type transport system permease protein